MKILLIILCSLAILFAGGCLVVLGSESGGMGALGPAMFALLCFNGLYIWAVRSKERAAAIVLMVCGVVDLGICAAITFTFNDQYVGELMMILFAVLGVKGIMALALGYRNFKASRSA